MLIHVCDDIPSTFEFDFTDDFNTILLWFDIYASSVFDGVDHV